MSSNYASWNDTAVAHMFMRLIYKINHPYNYDKLSVEQFQDDYNELKGYIDWHQNNYVNSSGLYNLTQTNIRHIFEKIDYDVDNRQELLDFWCANVVNIGKL